MLSITAITTTAICTTYLRKAPLPQNIFLITEFLIESKFLKNISKRTESKTHTTLSLEKAYSLKSTMKAINPFLVLSFSAINLNIFPTLLKSLSLEISLSKRIYSPFSFTKLESKERSLKLKPDIFCLRPFNSI